MQKDDSITSAGTEADSGQNDKDIFVSQHGRKPNVSGLPLLSEMSRFIKAEDIVKNKACQIMSTLKDVDVLQAKEAVGIISNLLFRVGQRSQEGLMMSN